MVNNWNNNLSGWWIGTMDFFFNDFSIILGMSSSQLICLLIFLPKMFGSKDSYVYIYIYYIIWLVVWNHGIL